MTEFFHYDPSILEASKIGSLTAKREQKTARLQSKPTYVPPLLGETSSGLGGLIDLAQSSGIQEAGNLKNAPSDLLNILGGTDISATQKGSISDPNVADSIAGVDPAYRQQYNADQTQLYTDYAKGNYGSALMDALGLAPRVAADSAGSVASGIIGGIATEGVGTALTGLRLVKKADSAYEEYQRVKKKLGVLGKATNGGNVAHLAKAAVKLAGRSSLMTAAETERQVQQYRQDHNGEDPSTNRYLTMALGAGITQATDFALAKHLFLPKGSKAVKDMQSIVRAMKPDSSAIASIGIRLGKGILKVSEAAGAEGVQEYLQTWQSILSEKVDPKTGQSLYDAVLQQVKNQDNRDNAAVGGLLGAAAGGATRSAGVIPTAGLGIAIDAAAGTTKTAYGLASAGVNALANKSARRKLSEEDKQNLRTEYDAQKIVANDRVASANNLINSIKKASSVEEITKIKGNEELATAILGGQVLSKEDQSSKVFLRHFKKALINAHEADIKTINKSISNSKLSHFKRKDGRPDTADIKLPATQEISDLGSTIDQRGDKAVANTENITPEQIDEINKYTEASRKAAKELETSLAVDTVTRILDTPTLLGKDITQRARDLSVHDLERIASIVSKSHPDVAATMVAMAKRKAGAIRRFTPSKNTVVTDDNLDKNISITANTGTLDSNVVPYISAALHSVMHKKISSIAALKAIQKTIGVYESTARVKKGGKGIIKPTTLAKWKRTLARKAEELATVEASKPKEEVKSKSKSKAKAESTSTEAQPDVGSQVTPEQNQAFQEFFDILNRNVMKAEENKLSVEPLFEHLAKAAEMLKAHGIITAELLDVALKPFPATRKNPEVFNALKLHMFNADIKDTEIPSKPMTEAQIVDAYHKLFPGCKI